MGHRREDGPPARAHPDVASIPSIAKEHSSAPVKKHLRARGGRPCHAARLLFLQEPSLKGFLSFLKESPRLLKESMRFLPESSAFLQRSLRLLNGSPCFLKRSPRLLKPSLCLLKDSPELLKLPLSLLNPPPRLLKLPVRFLKHSWDS